MRLLNFIFKKKNEIKKRFFAKIKYNSCVINNYYQ